MKVNNQTITQAGSKTHDSIEQLSIVIYNSLLTAHRDRDFWLSLSHHTDSATREQ